MSEKYGRCTSCGGTGEVRNQQTGHPESCWFCDGTGNSGNSLEWPMWKKDQDREAREYLDAMNEVSRSTK